MTRLSVFANAFATSPSGETSLHHFIEQVRQGAYAEPVRKVRAGELDKLQLPAVTFSGAFSARSSAGLVLHSGLLQIDMDGKDNPGTDMEVLKETLKSDPHVVAAFVSAGGKGLKAIIAIDGARHKESAIVAAGYFEAMYGVKIDPSCKDIPRLCFVSVDHTAWAKGGGGNTDDITILGLPPVGAESSSPPAAVPSEGDKEFEFGSVEHEAAVVARVDEVLSFIPTRPAYPEWIEILSGVFDELPFHHAVACLNAWSPEESENEYERKYPVRLRAIGFGTVVKMAIEYGFDNSPEKRSERAVARLPDLEAADLGGGPGAAKARILVHLDEVNDAKCAPEFVKSLLSVGGLSVLYGPGNVGKSFLWQDLAAHVARGVKWRNGEVIVRGGPVIYFALEGSFGVRKRILAMKKRGILPEDDIPLDLCFMPVRLLEEGRGRGAAVISDAIKECEDHWQQQVRWVVLDTLARTMAGGDENATKDMGRVVAECDAVKNKHLGTAIGTIHHSGKDIDRGMRGNTSLYDGVDTVIEVYRPEKSNVITATVRKQRELDFRDSMPYRLDQVVIGVDDDGEPITSCVCVHLPPEEGTIRGAEKKPRGPGRRVATHRFLELLSQPSRMAWWEASVKAELKVSRSVFYETVNTLIEQKRCILREDGSIDLSGDVYGFGGGNGGE